ncbi:MAG: elongation factor G [Phycisphaerales bacterium]
MAYTTKDIRNLAIVGGGGAGKTTLVETMLHHAGAIGRIGRVEDGNTVTDHTELEHEFKRSLETSVVHFDHEGVHVNIIDTPGLGDFVGSAMSVMPAVETAMVVVDAATGITPVMRRLMRIAKERRLPRVLVINRIDMAEDVPALFAQLVEAFGSELRPINLPAGGGTSVIDCFQNASGDSDLGPVAGFHTGIVDQVVEVDETLMAKYLDAGEVSPEELHEPFERALRDAHLVPVCFTSAKNDIGVAELMHVIEHLCPNPLEGNPRPFEYGSGDDRQDYACTADPSMPLVAHVFRVSSDPYIGRLSIFRVRQGTFNAGDAPLVGDNPKPVRVAHIHKVMGKEHAEVKQVIAGDIGAVAKIDEIEYDTVLHDGSIAADLRFRSIPLPKPMYGLAIVGTSKGAESKMGEALKRMMAEDPTFEVERVASTGELVIRGLGEQHLRIKLRLLKDRYGIEVDSHPPRVAYRETISGKAEGHHRHKKQSGGSGQFGEVFLRIEPVEIDISDGEPSPVDESGLMFVDETFGGAIPKQFLPAIEKGVRQVMNHGAIAGYPMKNVKVAVYDGKHHAVDSKEIAFITAGKRAFIDAVTKANPVLLEPIVAAEITVPADLIGDISSDISGRRGRILGTDMLPGGMSVVMAEAPLSEMMNYSSQLKSMTGGAGSYSMEYSHSAAAPGNVQADVVAQFAGHAEED